MIFKAIEFATRAHARQYRKGTKIPYPYIVHPLGWIKVAKESLRIAPDSNRK